MLRLSEFGQVACYELGEVASCCRRTFDVVCYEAVMVSGVAFCGS